MKRRAYEARLVHGDVVQAIGNQPASANDLAFLVQTTFDFRPEFGGTSAALFFALASIICFRAMSITRKTTIGFSTLAIGLYGVSVGAPRWLAAL